MTITAKFNSTCPVCGKKIKAGEQVEWQKGQKAKHLHCATQQPTNQDKVTYVYNGTKEVFETEKEALVAWLNDSKLRNYYGITKYVNGKLSWYAQPKITEQEAGVKIDTRGINRHIVDACRIEQINGINIMIK